MVSNVCWYNETGGSTSNPKLLSCSWDQSLRLWDVDASRSASTDNASTTPAPKCGEARCIVVGSALNDLSAAPQGILVAACDNKVRMYDLRAKGMIAIYFLNCNFVYSFDVPVWNSRCLQFLI